MTVTELDARLDERFSLLTGGSRAAPARQQTLHAVISWSWELVTGTERQVLALLSVFAGGFDLAAFEAVMAGADIPAGAAQLGALVDKSLVQFDDTGDGPGRYRLLETVRQFAAQRLGQQGHAADKTARTGHRADYLALAEAAAPRLTGPDQAEWLDRLDTELGNLRAAITFSLTREDPVPGLRLAAALRIFWKARGHATEAVDSLRALLAEPAARKLDLVRAQALATMAYLLEQTGGYAAAEACCAEALPIARAAGDDQLVADLLHIQAFTLVRQGQNTAALPLIEHGLSLARTLGDLYLTARLLSARSYAVDFRGDHEGAARDAAESLALYRQAGDPREVGTMLGNLAYAEMGAGDLDSARAHLAESLRIARELKDDYGVVYGTQNLGLAEYLSGCPTAAASQFAESLRAARRVLMKAGIGYALLGLAMNRSGPAATHRSARLHGAADKALEALGETPDVLERQLRDADRKQLRAAMGGHAFEAGYAAGQAMTTEEAIALALGGDTPAGDPASDASAAGSA